MQFDCRYLLDACIYISLLNVSDGIESEYPSIVFLSLYGSGRFAM